MGASGLDASGSGFGVRGFGVSVEVLPVLLDTSLQLLSLCCDVRHNTWPHQRLVLSIDDIPGHGHPFGLPFTKGALRSHDVL